MNPLTCEILLEQILEFIEGELPETVYFHFEQHVFSCVNCELFVESYTATVKVTRAIPKCDKPLPKEFEARLRAMFESTPG